MLRKILDFLFWKRIVFKFGIDKVNLLSIPYWEREKFLKILKWYYILELEKIPNLKNSDEINKQAIRSKAILDLYNELDNYTKAELQQIDNLVQEKRESEEKKEWKNFLFDN